MSPSCEGCEDTCEQCCDHEFDASEGFMCINCGKDGLEEMFAAAEVACEGDR
jgi:hypothetical protein